jgi:hypothetical protein
MKMLSWHGNGDDCVSLAVSGYQFPQITAGYDGNWLKVTFSGRNHFGAWSAESACLLTWDLLSLCEWLQDAQDDAADTWCCADMDLTIGCLGWSRGRAWLVVTLRYGFRNTALDGTGCGDKDIVVVGCTVDELAAARTNVAEALSGFPPRGEQGNRGINAVHSIRESRTRERLGPSTP